MIREPDLLPDDAPVRAESPLPEAAADYDHAVGAGLRLMLAVVVVAALSLLGSILLTATANGIGVLMIFGAGLLAGLLGSIGDAVMKVKAKELAGLFAHEPAE